MFRLIYIVIAVAILYVVDKAGRDPKDEGKENQVGWVPPENEKDWSFYDFVIARKLKEKEEKERAEEKEKSGHEHSDTV